MRNAPDEHGAAVRARALARQSLLTTGAPQRLAGAAALIVALWLVVAWALR